MKFGLKKNISALLIVLVAIPSIMFIKPKPADAIINCLLDAMGMLGGINGAVGGMMAVPVKDSAVGDNTSSSASSNKSNTTKECMLDQMAYTLINTLIQNFTASTVDWINSGFEGSPAFVTDPEGFFANVGDEVAGQWIKSLGPIGDVLCSPFDLKIRLSLSFGRTSSYRRTVGCRLSDVQKNVYGAFVGGDWGANGWSNWVSISQPNNNVYGAYITANNSVTQEMLRKMGINEKELDWNKGFLSFRKCKNKDASGKCTEYEKNSQTPGSVIETQLNNTLGSSQRRIEVADEINEIMDALINQAIGQVFKSTGLFGMSQNSSQYNGQTYLQSLSTTYEEQLANRTVKPPAWASCDKNYRIYSCTNNTVYPCIGKNVCTDGTAYPCAVDKYPKVVSEFLSSGIIDSATKECRQTVGTEIATGCYKAIAPQPDNAYLNANSIAQIENEIRRGCENLAIDGPADQAISDIIGNAQNQQGGGQGGGAGGGQPVTRIENVAINKPTVASSLGIQYDKSYAVDGLPGFNCAFSVFASQSEGVAGTWTVNLQTDASKPGYNIKYLAFSPRICGGQASVTSDLFITFNTDSGIKTWPSVFIDKYSPTKNYIFDSGSGIKSQVTLNNNENIVPINGVRSITIRNRDNIDNYLFIGELEALAIVTDTPADPGTPTTPTSIVKITTPNTQGIRIPEGGGVNYWINLTSSENLTELQDNIILNKIQGTEKIPQVLSNLFTKIILKRSLNCNDVNTEQVSPNDVPSALVNIRVPSSATKQYCLKVEATTKRPAPVGFYELESEIKDPGGLSAGKHKTSFEVYSTTAP